MEEVTSSDIPISGIKEYIINSRKNGYPDSKITPNLKKANWPDDVIEIALKEADAVIPAVAEFKKEEEKEIVQEKPNQETKQNIPSKVNTDDLFTKPPVDVFPEEQKPKIELKPRRRFSFLSLFALLFSPIPFVGLFIGIGVLGHIRKNKMIGGFFALLAILINLCVIGLIAYIIWQVFSLNPEELTGFSKYVNDMFKII